MGRIADDAARKVAVVVFIQFAQGHAGGKLVGIAVGGILGGAQGHAAVGLRLAGIAVDGIHQRQGRCLGVVADDAAHIGVGVQVQLVAQLRQGDVVITGISVGVHNGVAAAKAGQQGREVCRHRAVLGQRVGQLAFRNHAVVADDTARHAVRQQAAGADGADRRRVAGSIVEAEALHRQVGAYHTADIVQALNAVGADLYGGQLICSVQADHAAHTAAGRHDLAADAGERGVFIGNGGAYIVVTGNAAHIAAAVEHRAQLDAAGGTGRPVDAAIDAVVTGHAADKIGIVGLAVSGLAQLLQQGDLIAVGHFDRGHIVGAVDQLGGVLVRQGLLCAPGGIVDTGNAAHISGVFAQACHQTLVGHVQNLAVAAVDRHDAAHIAVAEYIAVVHAAVCAQVAAHKAANEAAHKAAAQHIAGLGGAVGHPDIAAKAHKAAHEVALQRAALVQGAVLVIAVAY